MDDIDEFFRKSCYSNLRILLISCGIWPFQMSRKRYAMYVGFLALFGFGIMFEMVWLFKVWPDFYEVFDCVSLLCYGFSSIIKLIYTVYKLPTIKMFFIKIHEHWCSSKSDGEAKIMHSHVLFARKWGNAYADVILVPGLIFVFSPFLTKYFYNGNTSNGTQDAESTLHINYMIDLQMQYTPLLIHGTVCEFYHALIMTTINVMYLFYVQHCCGLFAALRNHLENAFEFGDNDGNTMTMSAEKKCYLNVAYSVRRHVEAIQFASAIESLYRLPFLMHMTVNVAMLSIVGFQVITNTDNISHMILYAIYMNGLIINMFFENWQGQKIIDCNEKLYDSVYNTEWYKMPIMSQKLLIMIMMRSKKPLTITAGKVLILSYVTFNAAMRTGFSYLMILRSTQ